MKESLATRGFNVTNFVTYHLMLLASILDAARAKEVNIFPEQSVTSSSIFDPFCLLSPWLIYGKALLREVTKSKVGLGRVGYTSYSHVGLISFCPVDDCYYRVCSTYH